MTLGRMMRMEKEGRMKKFQGLLAETLGKLTSLLK